TSRPGPVLGPTAVRTSVTEVAEPSNIGILVPRFAVMNSAADRSAARRFNATVNNSPRWTRRNPRFQLGSHWAVMAPMAAKITPIRVVATSASRRVNPATLERRCRYKRFIGLADVAGERSRIRRPLRKGSVHAPQRFVESMASWGQD